MWIFLNDAFLSVVADIHQPRNLLVRARRAGEIEAVFPDVVVSRTEDADYRFRASVPRSVVSSALSSAVTLIEYPNFKNSVADVYRYKFYSRVWQDALRYQETFP